MASGWKLTYRHITYSEGLKSKQPYFFHKFPEGTVEKQKRELLIWGNPVENRDSGTPNTITEDTDNFVI